jgi:hypothetical protein
MRFIRGLLTLVGFRQTGIAGERSERGAGQLKYTFRALAVHVIDALVRFNSHALRLLTYRGLAIVAFAAILVETRGETTDS